MDINTEEDDLDEMDEIFAIRLNAEDVDPVQLPSDLAVTIIDADVNISKYRGKLHGKGPRAHLAFGIKQYYL